MPYLAHLLLESSLLIEFKCVHDSEYSFIKVECHASLMSSSFCLYSWSRRWIANDLCSTSRNILYLLLCLLRYTGVSICFTSGKWFLELLQLILLFCTCISLWWLKLLLRLLTRWLYPSLTYYFILILHSISVTLISTLREYFVKFVFWQFVLPFWIRKILRWRCINL